MLCGRRTAWLYLKHTCAVLYSYLHRYLATKDQVWDQQSFVEDIRGSNNRGGSERLWGNKKHMLFSRNPIQCKLLSFVFFWQQFAISYFQKSCCVLCLYLSIYNLSLCLNWNFWSKAKFHFCFGTKARLYCRQPSTHHPWQGSKYRQAQIPKSPL